MADNPFGGPSAMQRSSVQSALLRFAQHPTLRPLVEEAAKQTMTIELQAHKGRVAAALYDRFYADVVAETNQMLAFSANAVRLASDDAEVQRICAGATEELMKEYVRSKQTIMQEVARTITNTVSQHVRIDEPEENRLTSIWNKFWNEW